MDLQNGLPPCQVRQFHRNPPVKPAGPGQRRVQRFRPVGGSQDDDAGILLKAIHLGQQLVQGLFPLIVAAVTTARAALLTNGIDLIDEHDAGSLLLSLPEKVPDFRGAHAYEHLYKLRPGDGKEGNIGFSGHRLGQHGLAGTRRAYQQNTLRHGCAGFRIFPRVVQVVHDF